MLYKPLLHLMLIFHFLFSPKPQYIIVVGKITCKTCVVALHKHLSQQIKARPVLGISSRNSVITAQLSIGYFMEVIPGARFIQLPDSTCFLTSLNYPYLLKITGPDTLKIPYDSMFVNGVFNPASLKNR